MHFVGGDSARVVHEALAQNELLEVASHRVFECRHFPRQRLFAPRRAHRLLQNGRRGVERLFFRTSQSLAVCVEPERGVAQGQEAVQQGVRHPHVVAVLGEHHLVPRPCAAALGPSPCLAASLLGGGQFVESLVRVREAAGTRRLPACTAQRGSRGQCRGRARQKCAAELAGCVQLPVLQLKPKQGTRVATSNPQPAAAASTTARFLCCTTTTGVVCGAV
mmetsp:Transcript_25491/g.52250  ORF Transcript_25491/g.52250 Transcript_25491/m.52250 type:complete len:220 (+) Transcript_25491:213-872(+)